MYYTPLKKYQGCIYESKKEQNKEEPTKTKQNKKEEQKTERRYFYTFQPELFKCE